MNNLKMLQELGLLNRISNETLKEKLELCNDISVYNASIRFLDLDDLEKVLNKYKEGRKLHEKSVIFYQKNFHFDFVRSMESKLNNLKQRLIDMENILVYESNVDTSGECFY